MGLKEKLENLVLKSNEDTIVLDNLLNEINDTDYNNKLIITLLGVLERNPSFHFGMPGNIVRAIEKYYQQPSYEELIMQSIERVPTEYNLWLLNRLLNSYKADKDKERGVSLLRKIDAETTDENIKEIVQDFLSDYD